MTESRPPGSSDAGSDKPNSPDRTEIQPTAEETAVPAEPQPAEPTGSYPEQDQTNPRLGAYGQAYPPQQAGGAQPQYSQQQQYPQGYPEQPAYWQQSGYPQYSQQPYAYSQQLSYGYAQPTSYDPTGQYAQTYPYAPAGGYGAAQPGAYPGVRPHRRAFGVVATLLTLIGGAALVVSFTAAVKWFTNNGTHLTFSGLRGTEVLRQPNPPTLPYAYFNWLAWALLGIVVVSGILGALPTPAHVTFRVLGGLAGVAGVVVTYFAYYRLLGAATGYKLGYAHSFQGARGGLYLALGGFLVAAIGAVTGPHRRKQAPR